MKTRHHRGESKAASQQTVLEKWRYLTKFAALAVAAFALSPGFAAQCPRSSLFQSLQHRDQRRKTNVPAGNDHVAISAGYLHGLAIQVQRPVLTIAQVGTDVVLSWSTNQSGYSLETTSDLSSTLDGSAVPSTPTMIGDPYVITNSVATGHRFFRLKR